MLRMEDYFGGKRLQLPLMDHVVHAAVRDKIHGGSLGAALWILYV
jgi:hypothetical protein